MTIIIPTPLRQYVDGQAKIEVTAPTVKGALDALTLERPELRKHLFNAEGKVRYLPQKEDSAVMENDTLTIIPSIAGGSSFQPSAFSRQLEPQTSN
jgi:sulfur-carrier protein